MLKWEKIIDIFEIDMRINLFSSLKLQVLFILLAIIAVYHHIPNAPFLWDDEVMIVGNNSIKGETNIVKIFTTGAFGGSLESSSFYRPIQILSYSLDYKIGGLNPTGYHITNLLLFFLSCVFLLLILRNLGIGPGLSFIIVLFFCIHPINIENVTYLAGRGDVLCTFFSFLSLFLVTHTFKSQYRFLWAVLAVLFYLLALFSKENTVFLPLVIIFMFTWKKEIFYSHKPFYIVLLTIFLATLSAFLFFKFYHLANLQTKSLSLIADAPLEVRLFTFPSIIVTYLRLLIIPFNYHMEYHFLNSNLFTVDFFILLIICLFLIYIYIRKIIPRNEFIFYLAWFIIFLLPVMNVFYPLAATLREHWVSFSSVAIFLFIGRLLEIYQVKNFHYFKIPIGKILILLGLLYMGSFTYVRNKDWKDPFRLYAHDVKYAPKSFILWNNLGVEYFRKQQPREAERCFEQSENVCPGAGYAPTFNNLGVIKQNNGLFIEAEELYLKAIELEDYLLAFQNLGRILIFQKRFDEANAILEKGNALYPDDPEIIYFLGYTLFNLGEQKKAEALLSYLERIYPDYKQTRSVLRELRK